MECFLFILLGACAGATTMLLFFRNDPVAMKYISMSASNAGFFGSFFLFFKYMEIPSTQKATLLVSYIVAALIATIVVGLILSYFIQQQDHNLKIKVRISDIVFGYKDMLKLYYESRQREVDSLIKDDEIKRRHADIEAREKSLKQKEDDLSGLELKIKKSTSGIVHLNLPIDHRFPLDNEFVELLPNFVENVVRFSLAINCLTHDFVSKSEKYISEKGKAGFIKGYFMGLCAYTAEHLFDSTSVRVHIRCLTSDGCYKKLVAYKGKKEFSDPLTPIPSNKGMIRAAGIAKRSLIKSINPDHHCVGANDHVWQDYITTVFDKIYIDDIPLLSMGISVNNKEKFKYLLYFLSHSRIESIVQDNIIKIDRICDIKENLYTYKMHQTPVAV